MPEGPSIVLLSEALQPFVDKQIINADGSSKKSTMEGFPAPTSWN
jgi:hypothetical protein